MILAHGAAKLRAHVDQTHPEILLLPHLHALQGGEWGKFIMKREERAFRHEQNRRAMQGAEDILPAGVRQRQG